MENYIYQRIETNVLTDKDGKTTGKKSVFTRESDENGNLKEPVIENYVLDKGSWALDSDKNAKNNFVCDEQKKNTVVEKLPEPVLGKFKDGDILKAEYPDRNVYVAYKNDTTAYWALVTSLTPGKNNLYGADGVEVKFDEYGFNFDDFDRVTRDEVFAVERFIQQNTGFRWDWRNKTMVKD